ncbi:MAG: hypothetical protein K0R18_1620 [Bacillales bacterium]|nr:hypothetical protein [Bacillales bacterium]
MQIHSILFKLKKSFWLKKVLEFSLCVIAIVFLSYLLIYLPKFFQPGPISDRFPTLEQFFHYLKMISHPAEILFTTISVSTERTYKFIIYHSNSYVYSIGILLISIFTTILFGLLMSYFYMNAGRKIKKVIEAIAVFIESIPDLMFIFSFQIVFIWIYRTTGWLPIRILSFGEDQAWLLPVLCAILVPTLQFFRVVLLFGKSEMSNMYVEFAYSRGFGKGYIIRNHVLRNILRNLLNQYSSIYVFTLSNLFIIERAFNINGFMGFFLQPSLKEITPELVFIWLLMLFLPFFIIRTIIELIVHLVLGGEVNE